MSGQWTQIIEAGKLATARPWEAYGDGHMRGPIEDGEETCPCDCKYTALAANHADDMAKRLMELRAMLLPKIEPSTAGHPIVRSAITHDEARHLLELLTEPQG